MTADGVRELVGARYTSIATELLAPLLKMLSASRETFGGDLDRFLIIIAIGLRSIAHPDFRSLTHDEFLEGRIPELPSLGTNVRSVADSLDMPKESVRRKVAELLEAGWLVRRDNRLYLTTRAYRDLAPLREQLLDFTVRCWQIVDQLKQDAED